MSMKLFEMKQERFAALNRSEAIINAAQDQKRELTPEEDRNFKAAMREVDALAVGIAKVEAMNTINPRLGALGSLGFFNPALGAKTGVPSAPEGNGRSLREALEMANNADATQVKAFANYLGGDMTALADLRPSGDGGVFIPTIIAGVVARNFSAYSPVRDNATG